MNNTQLSTEERIWSVLAHLSALAFGMGILLPVIGWSEQRSKSKYASFQCLQALGYQSLGFTFWLLSYLVVFVGIMIVFVVMSFQAESAGRPFDPTDGPILPLIYLTAIVFMGIYVLLPVVASVACVMGRDFRYPIMGNRLANYLGYQSGNESSMLIEEHEDRWVVAMGHFAVIILLWGMIAPITAWILQGRRSAFMKFQSVQTTVYQAGVTILYFAGIFIYGLGFAAFIAATGFVGAPGGGLPIGLISFGIFILFSLIALLLFMLVPLCHILGQWAGYRVLKGDHYRYPLVGKLVEIRIAKGTLESGSSLLEKEKPS
jgi:uncharacterized Tic20 family protein